MESNNYLVPITDNENKKSRWKIYLCIFFTLLTFICALSTRVVVRKGEKYYKEEQISLYILTYDGELPTNFITKSQAKKRYNGLYYKEAYYKVIKEGYNLGGGPHDASNSKEGFDSNISNYTASTNLRECDIYVVSNAEIARRENRGEYRIVYTSDGSEVYYTADHYKTFKKRTPWSINFVSNTCWIFFGVISCSEVVYLFAARFRKKYEELHEVKEATKDFAVLVLALIILPFYLIYLLVKKLFFKAKA